MHAFLTFCIPILATFVNMYPIVYRAGFLFFQHCSKLASIIHGCIFPDLWVKVPEEQSWYLLFSHEDVFRRSVPSAAEWYHLPMMLAWGQRLILDRICRICGIVSLFTGLRYAIFGE